MSLFVVIVLRLDPHDDGPNALDRMDMVSWASPSRPLISLVKQSIYRTSPNLRWAGITSPNRPLWRKATIQPIVGAGRVLLTTSGTHALKLALLALGIGAGQEVICPSFTFVSSANAVLRVGARPVFADIEERTLGLAPADVEARLSPRTVALMPVHYAGVAPEMEALLDIARRRGLRVVEDAAQGLAASWRGRPLGTLGDAGSFPSTRRRTSRAARGVRSSST
jgi:hypothetical protein